MADYMLPDVTDEVALKMARNTLAEGRKRHKEYQKKVRVCKECGRKCLKNEMSHMIYSHYRNKQWVCKECESKLPPKVVNIEDFRKR